MSERLIAHMHIPKCGGTSLLELFREWYPNRVLKSDNPKFEHIDKNQYRVISGHYPYNDSFWDCRWVTFVRHPIDRLKSFYYYKQGKMKNRRNAHQDYWWRIMKLGEMSLEEWLLCEESKNMMVKQFAGKRPQDAVSRDDLRMAMKNAEGFYFIGFQEDYSKDINRLAQMLNKPINKIPHRLPSQNDGIFEPYELYGNLWDMELYMSIKSKRKASL